MASTILQLEGSTIGVTTAISNLYNAQLEGHTYCTIESTVELFGGMTAYTYYSGKFFDLLPLIASVFKIHIPDFLFFCTSLVLKYFLGFTGIILNVSRGTKEALSLYRQHQFLSLFKKHAWKGSDTQDVLAGTIEHFDEPGFQENLPQRFRTIITGKKPELERLLTKIKNGDQKALDKAERVFARWTARGIRDKLAEVTNLSDVELERALPVWLNTDIVKRGGKELYLSNLLKKVDKGDLQAIDEATKLLDTMQTYAGKKYNVPILRIISSVISAVACIGFFVALPWPVTVMFLVLIGIASAAAYMYNAGYVENSEDCFSLKLCIPEFIRDLAFDISNSPETFRVWINEKLNEEKPKVLTPDPFFKRRFAQAQLKYSPERLERLDRLAKRGIIPLVPSAA